MCIKKLVIVISKFLSATIKTSAGHQIIHVRRHTMGRESPVYIEKREEAEEQLMRVCICEEKGLEGEGRLKIVILYGVRL